MLIKTLHATEKNYKILVIFIKYKMSQRINGALISTNAFDYWIFLKYNSDRKKSFNLIVRVDQIDTFVKV